VETRLRIHNQQRPPLRLTIEPWGDVHQVNSGEAVDIVASGPEGGILETVSTEDGLTVYGWPGSVVHLLREGKIYPGHVGRQAVPATPPGMSVKNFVGWMNKNTGKA
jgi:hypothetical protein